MMMLIPAGLLVMGAGLALTARGNTAIERATLGSALGLLASLVLALAAALGQIPGEGLVVTLMVLTSFVATIALAFSSRYMRADRNPQRFAVTVALLAASVLLAVAAEDALTLALGWLASGQLLASLIGHVDGWAEAKTAERRARRAFIIGDAALLVALAVLAMHAGSIELKAMLSAEISFEPVVLIMVAALFLVAAMARSALPPFDGWLIGSMTAPTPVSALMHAGLVNAGGFLLIRFAPVMEAAPLVQIAAVIAGIIAALWGTGIALVRPDIKRSLAGSTVAQMGFMILSCGMGAYAAALWHLVAHGLFKAWLFLRSGSAIGGQTDTAMRKLDGTTLAAISAVVIGVGVTLVSMGRSEAALLPLLLATATGLATALGTMRAKTGRWVQLLGFVVVLVVAHTAGLTLIGAGMAHAEGVSPVAGAIALFAALPFLGVWVWQSLRGNALPPTLYVRLLNAGVAA